MRKDYFDRFIPKGFRVIRKWYQGRELPPSSYTNDVIFIRPRHKDVFISSNSIEEYNSLSDFYEWNDKWEGASRFTIIHNNLDELDPNNDNLLNNDAFQFYYGICAFGVYIHNTGSIIFDSLHVLNRKTQNSGIGYERTYRKLHTIDLSHLTFRRGPRA